MARNVTNTSHLVGKTIETVKSVTENSGEFYRITFTDKTRVDVRTDSIYDKRGMYLIGD